VRSLYPPIEPYASGTLDVGDGHAIYFERCGKPGGKPAVFLHGGPGGGITPNHRRLFDPDKYDVLLFDQRGCGRSTPHAEIEANTTWHILADIERLRESIEVDRWLVFGGSWGSTLGIAYAEKHPERVSELILRGVYTVTQAEIAWYYQFGASEMFPDKWERFQAPVPIEERGNMVRAYRRLLTGSDTIKQLEAAIAWSTWEGETITLIPDSATLETHADPHFAIAFARLENHFFFHNCWIEEGQLLREAGRLRDIPGVIVHGRYDMPCPARYAYELHKAWPQAEFYLIEGAGHAYTEPEILDRLIRATDGFAD
jgi:proline iminopeptidase